MARRKDSPQKAAMREMMRDYLKNNDISIKDGTDVNSIMRDMMSVLLEGALDEELDEELGYSKYDYRKTFINTFIFETLIRNYCDADKTNGLVVLSADNIGLYINIWHKNNHLFTDNYTNTLITIIHSKLLNYYNCSYISDYDISLVCNATDKLISMYGSNYFTKI